MEILHRPLVSAKFRTTIDSPLADFASLKEGVKFSHPYPSDAKITRNGKYKVFEFQIGN